MIYILKDNSATLEFVYIKEKLKDYIKSGKYFKNGYALLANTQENGTALCAIIDVNGNDIFGGNPKFKFIHAVPNFNNHLFKATTRKVTWVSVGISGLVYKGTVDSNTIYFIEEYILKLQSFKKFLFINMCGLIKEDEI